MIGVILGVGHNAVRQNPCHVVLEIHNGIDNTVEEARWHVKVAVVG